MNKEKRFPTILGLIFLIVCIAVGVYLTRSNTSLGSKASGDCTPVNPQVANITNSSADISFYTTALCSASVSVNNQLFSDIKLDVATKIHYFQIKNLKNNTVYNYSVISGGQSYNETSFSFETGSSPISELPTSNLAWGKVLAADSQSTVGAVVYLNIPGASPLSSFVTTDGNWSVSLANSFNDSHTDWFVPPQNPVDEDIVVISEDGTTTQVTNSTAVNNPVPNIIIGHDSLSAPLVTTIPVGKITDTTSAVSEKAVDIFNPQENETLNVTRPDFFGTAPVNSSVVIEVHSDTIVSGNSQADSTGSWHWSPPSDLTPGQHTITVKVQDSAGVWQTVTRNFTVLAADSGGPAYEASGSATNLTPTATVKPLATSTPTPVIAVSQTPTATLQPTSVSVIETAAPSTVSTTLYQTGDSIPTYFLVLLSLILFSTSLYYFNK